MNHSTSPQLGSGDRLVSHEYFEIILRGDGIVWLRRTAAIFRNVAEIHSAYHQFLRVVDDWLLDRRIKLGHLGTRERTPMAWLYDVRSAPERRNDPEFEQVIQERRADLLKRSPALAVLVQTASGKMQVTRLARTANANVLILDDLEQAVAALQQKMKDAFSSP